MPTYKAQLPFNIDLVSLSDVCDITDEEAAKVTELNEERKAKARKKYLRYRALNIEKIRERGKRYSIAHRVEKAAYRRAYYWAHHEHCLEVQRIWRANHNTPEYRKELARKHLEYYYKNRERINAQRRANRVKRKKQQGLVLLDCKRQEEKQNISID